MKRTSMKTRWRNTGPSAEVVAAVMRRDHGCCVRCGRGVSGERGMNWSIQHRLRRGAGSTRRVWVNEPANLIVLCGHGSVGCHFEVESRRTRAEAAGYVVRDGTTLPADVPVQHALFGRVRLDNYGGYKVVAG